MDLFLIAVQKIRLKLHENERKKFAADLNNVKDDLQNIILKKIQ